MKTFLKANAASLTASFCDYLVTIIFKQVAHLDAVVASIIGTIVGGIINFLIGRHWVFGSSSAPFLQQGKRYIITWTGNLVLNALGVYLLTKHAGIHYLIAKVITSLSVAFGYNYPMQKKYVFKNIDIKEKV
jgi:putative flippase GtrA